MASGGAISEQEMTAQEDSPSVEASAREDRGCKPLLRVESVEEESAGTRRGFLGRSVRKLAYVSPVVLLLRPRPACASRIYS